MRGVIARVAAVCLLLVAADGAVNVSSAQTPQNVAVVINVASPDSVRIGEYYVRQRGIPAANVIRIRTTDDDVIERPAYAATIEQPIALTISRERLHDRVLYIVLTKGIPLRIAGTTGAQGTGASVDSELALLYRRMTGAAVGAAGAVENPYFLGARNVAEARRFTHATSDIFLVSRLTAFTVEQAMALVDNGRMPQSDGKFVLDQRDLLVDRTGDNWLEAASKRLADLGLADRVVLESTPKPARDVKPVMAYYSWGSNDPQNHVRTSSMGFVPGSIAALLATASARTFTTPAAGWVPGGDPKTPSNLFAGSTSSLLGDLIREGATGVAGDVAEPAVSTAVRPDILLPAYAAGFNLVEAFYLAMPYLSWQTVVVGDPLCAPFEGKAIPPAELDSGIDEGTLLPAYFAKRRVEAAAVNARGLSREAIALSIRAEGLLIRGDVPAARTALERAAQQAPDAAPIHLQLALVLQQLKDDRGALAQYRRVVELQPNNVIALNNLAYALATTEKNPAEALPLAQRAAAAAPRDGGILDTLAWVQHLGGDDVGAAKTIAQAIARAPRAADLRLHAAIINAAAGATAVAADELRQALELDPAIGKRPEAQELQRALEKQGAGR